MIFNYLNFLLTTYKLFFCLHVIEVIDDPRFNDIFNEDFDGNYDNVMNRIVDHINYPSCEGSGALVVGA